jgi:orotate phosphoribosyltransferase
MSDRNQLLTLIKELAVVHGEVTLSSGQQADYYIDLRRITLHRKAAPLVGRVLRELTSDLDYDAAGGLTLGADPVGTAILHASDGAVDAFVVRKAEKQHGMQQRVEGPAVTGRRVLVVEDVSTTGSSPLTAVQALREAGAQVVAVALIVDRGAGDTIREAGLECRAAYSLADLGLG